LARIAEPAARLGRVVAVDGARATIAARTSAALAGTDNPLAIGKLISIDCGPSRVIGLIYSTAAAEPHRADSDVALVKVELVGEIRQPGASGSPGFDRGIRRFPAVGAAVESVGPGDLQTIYDYGGEAVITVGRLSQDANIEATLRVNDLLQKHFAILGTTGCGKSSAVALLLRQVMKASPQTRVLLVDPHNEYRDGFADCAEVMSPRNLNLPFWLFNFEEIVDVFYRRRPGVEEEIDALADLIPMAKANVSQRAERSSLLRKDGTPDGGYTVDSPVPYRIADLLAMIDEQIGRLDGKDNRPKLRRLKARIESVVNDPRYHFMFSHRTVEDSMAEVLKKLFRVPMEGRPITIMEMAGFPAEVVDAVVSVVARLAFDVGVWSEGRLPLVVVCEEAHRYVPADKRLGFGPTRRAISRIAKEGRKYGVSLGIVTQRPAELDPTILSQCSTIFAMRMANDADHAIIRSAVSDAAASTLESLPSMGNREALAFGEAVSMPMRVRFASLPREHLPNNKAEVRGPSSDPSGGDFMEDLVRRWRSVAQRD